MRIVHVIARMDAGGAERVLLSLAADQRHHHEVTVVSGGGAWVDRLRDLGVTHVTLPGSVEGRAPSLAATVRAVRRVTRELDPDVVHTTNVRVTLGAAIGVRLSGRRPVVLTSAQGTAPAQMRRAARILTRTSPVVVGCAESVTEDLARAGFPRARLRTIANAAALEPAGPDRTARVSRRLGLDDRPLVVGVGRLVPQKNWPVLIGAMRGLDRIQVVVAGAGPLLADLQRQAADAGHVVRFVGRVDDIAALVGRATCVVSTSDWEGLPLALLETMSLGVPVVATAVDGNVRHLDRGAVLVAPGDPAAVRGAVERLVDDPAHRATLATGATAAAAAWSPAAMARAYHDLYAELVG